MTNGDAVTFDHRRQIQFNFELMKIFLDFDRNQLTNMCYRFTFFILSFSYPISRSLAYAWRHRRRRRPSTLD